MAKEQICPQILTFLFVTSLVQIFYSKCILILVEGAMGMSGDSMVSPDGKPKTDVKDDTGPANEPHKPKVPL